MIFVLIIGLYVIFYTARHRENKLHTYLLYNSIVAFIYLAAYTVYCFLVPIPLKIHCLSIEFIMGTCSFTYVLFIVLTYFENNIVENKGIRVLVSIVPVF